MVIPPKKNCAICENIHGVLWTKYNIAKAKKIILMIDNLHAFLKNT